MSVILVVDNHSVYRTGFRKLIETRFPLLRVVEASKLPHSDIDEGFDLVLIDSGSLSYDTLELLAEWHEVGPKARIAILSGSKSRVEALHYLSAGFHGFYTSVSQRRSCLTLSTICSLDAYTFRAGLSTVKPTMTIIHFAIMFRKKH
ncbi:hypothetical protein ACFIOY_22000 [Bradyrhizobium sp. TZ2]